LVCEVPPPPSPPPPSPLLFHGGHFYTEHPL
jgi:hypothetical protein